MRLQLALAALAIPALTVNCSGTDDEGTQESGSKQVGQARQAVAQATPKADAKTPIRIRVPGVAQGLAKDSVIRVREPGYRFTGGSVSKIHFAKPRPAASAAAHLKKTAARFFPASAASDAAAEKLLGLATKTQEDVGGTMVSLEGADNSFRAYTHLGSGALALMREIDNEHAITIGSANEAVKVALSFIAENELLTLADHESLEVAGIMARHHAAVDDSGIRSQEKVGYMLRFGRSYRGVPVLGPSVVVEFDSDGRVAGFDKRWRDIEGESGSIALASASEVESRHDPIMRDYLVEKESDCGYAEDTNPHNVQDSPGVACRYAYVDPSQLGWRPDPVEWVNVAADRAAAPLQNKRNLE